VKLFIGTWDPAWGYTWVARGFGKLYALRSLAGGSFLCVEGKEYPTSGQNSCHITLLDRQAVVSDYTSGTLSLFPLDKNGIPAGEPEILHFEGRGPHPVRQTSPHIHSSWLSPNGDSLVVVDLGTDRLYRFPVHDGKMAVDGKEVFQMPNGCGPRHCAFGESSLYVSTELSDEVLVLDWPSMELMQRIVVNKMLPGGGGHLLLSPDKRFLYASSRLQNDGIAVFTIGENGYLEPAGYFNTELHPRHFCLSPDGESLLVACKDGDCVQVFGRSRENGLLSGPKELIKINKPVFVDCYEED